MDISISQQNQEQIRRKVASGVYRSADEVIAAALTLLNKRDEQLEELRDRIRREVGIKKDYGDLVEIYTPARIAEFLLNNSIDEEDYKNNRKEVEKLGLDLDEIPHEKPWA